MRLEISDARFRYTNDKLLFDKVNFGLNAGEVLAVLGPNGVGKTSLIKCLANFMSFTAGKNLLDGVEISSYTEKQLWQKISYVPQKRFFSFDYTGIEMVVMGLNPVIGSFAKPRSKDYDKARGVMVELGIEKLEHKYCSIMSGGQLQMVLIARSLVKNPELIILDEPESGLDFKNQIKILDLIQKLAQEKNIGAILNTHYPDHALKIADKALILKEDGTHFVGDVKHIITEDNLRDAFGVRALIREIQTDIGPVKTVIAYKIEGENDSKH